jgi:hypothetical protein
MDTLHPSTGQLPPTLRALALGLLVETVVPLLAKPRVEIAAPPGSGNGEAKGKAELWQAMRGKCGELSALVLRADDPKEAAAYVLGYLPKHFKYVLEPAQGRPVQ